MAESKPKYFAIFVIFAISAVISTWVRTRPIEVTYDADMKALPSTIDGWKGEDLSVSSEIKGALDADRVLSRLYINNAHEAAVQLLLVYRKFGRRGFAHRPEMCYPAAGWEIVSKTYITVPYAGKNVQSVKIVAQKEQMREIIVYWFASGQRTEANFAKQQLMMALDRLQPQKYGWAFIRINSPVTVSDAETIRQIRHFVEAASNPLTDVLTGTSAR